MSAPSETFSVRLPEPLRAELDRFAAERKRSRAFVIKEAVSAYMEEQKAYETAVQEALAEAEKGVFVSGDAVTRWLGTWGTGQVGPAPEPDILADERED